VLFNSTAKET